MLRPAGHPGLDLRLAQVGRHVLDDVLQEHIAPRRALGHQPGDLVVALGEQGGEGQVLKFPLDGVHAQPVRERREDLQHLARLLLLLGPRQVAQGPHVVQPVGELDDQDPDVAGHGDDHLADRLGLGRVAVFDLVELGHAVDQRGDVVAEVAAQLGQRVGGVLDGVVQQRRAQRLVVHAELGQDRGHRQRVRDVRVAALAHLAGVQLRGNVVGALDQPDIGLGMRRADRLDQRLEHRVGAAAAGRAQPGQPAPDAGRPGGRAADRRGLGLAAVRGRLAGFSLVRSGRAGAGRRRRPGRQGRPRARR